MVNCKVCNKAYDYQDVPDDVTYVCRECLDEMREVLESAGMLDEIVGKGIDSQEV